ncbi:hypothetical protein CEE69_11950 [Rhodopirellula bahusiensis]|uniref:Uncharacterized protein n=1 Tax=Rhodopirellula bahusiensis TaxID=2014065 RepID=A0A2G1W7V1_9BACT|nr:hypothetical protein CEE69_11950 [Rhodopirellula bahusiensis]
MVSARKFHRDHRREPNIEHGPKADITGSVPTLDASAQELDRVSVLGMKALKIPRVGDSYVSVAHSIRVPRIDSQ